nr:MAG TPA: hypothetical protein [Caudoviricetes sp.]
MIFDVSLYLVYYNRCREEIKNLQDIIKRKR